MKSYELQIGQWHLRRDRGTDLTAWKLYQVCNTKIMICNYIMHLVTA